MDEEDASLLKISPKSMEDTLLLVRKKGVVVHAQALRRPSHVGNKEDERFMG